MKLVALLVVVVLGGVASADNGVDQAVLAKIKQRGQESRSDAIVIYKDGKLVAEWYFGKPQAPIEAMSATKSIVGLAIGRLIDTGKLKSLDQPVHEFFPEWKQGKKQQVTIRHLLNHTSGLQNVENTGAEIYPSPDFVKLALAAELDNDPGTKFAYNNKAVNLLAGIVKIASGKRMDVYIRDEIFTPLGITDATWSLDDAGNPQAMSGLQIRAQDLATIGLMLEGGGQWKGKRIISAKWIAESTGKPGQAFMGRYGLLWWLQTDFRGVIADDELVATWRKGGDSEAFIAKVKPLKGKVFTNREQFFAALEKAFGGKQGLETWYDNTWRKGLPDGKVLPAPVTGFYADGYLGQYLVVIPSSHIVAVRQMRASEKSGDPKLDTFHEFPDLVKTLVSVK